MTAFTAPDTGVVDQRVLRAAVSAYLGRYRGETRLHTGSDLQVVLRWCTGQDLDPLAAIRVDTERYVRWLQGFAGRGNFPGRDLQRRGVGARL
jgi:hypothetical protein